jgi:hypothetical protein
MTRDGALGNEKMWREVVWMASVVFVLTFGVRKFGDKTQNDYIRHVKTFSTLLVPSPLDLLKPFSSKTDT